MGNACGAGSSGAVREQRAEGSAEQMCKRRGSSVITDRKIKRHDVRQDYDLGKLLGEGAFGKVHAGTLKRSESEKPPIATTTEGGESPCPEEKCERAIKFLGVAALKATGVDDEINTMRRVSRDHHRSRSRGGARGGDGVRRCPPACGPTQIPPFPARSALR